MGGLVQQENRQYSGLYPGFYEVKEGMPEENGQWNNPDDPSPGQQ
ncbi:MAG: hypothetical protein WBC70_03015 [Candidatus Aminicenantales bacterium]